MQIDLSKCASSDQILEAVTNALADMVIVSGRRGARRWFRKAGIKGRIREDVVFRDRREVRQLGPLHRNLLVCTAISRYTAGGDEENAVYDVAVVTY